MKQADNHADQQFDEFLRIHGPEVPEPSLDEHMRAKFMSSINETAGQPHIMPATQSPHWLRWVMASGASLAAALGLVCALLWSSLGQARTQLATSRWQTEEAIQLLINARMTQPSIPVPERLDGLTSSDLVLITFDHALCPVAKVCTPKFKELENLHGSEAARFITYDVNGSNRALVEQEIESSGMQYALLGPPGAETGVVKVLDVTHRRVLCSAPGREGIEQAALLLARVSNEQRLP